MSSYVPPPKHTDYDTRTNWPYKRCKNLVEALKTDSNKPATKSHDCYLNWLAAWFNMPLEEFKKVSMTELVEKNKGRIDFDARCKLIHTYSRHTGPDMRRIFGW